MDWDSIIVDVVGDFLANEKQKILYLSLDSSLMWRFASLVPGNVSIYDLKETIVSRSPLTPFMQAIKDSKPTKDVIVENTYSLQREAFLAYFTGDEIPERQDVLISGEVYYEKKRIKETVVALLSQTLKNCAVILNAQELSTESISILHELEKNELAGKMIFCFDLSNLASTITPNPFFKEVSTKKNYFEINYYENPHEDSFLQENLENNEAGIWSEKKADETFEDLHLALFLNRMFLSLEQANKLCKYVADNLMSFDFMKEQGRSLYYQMALVCFYSGDYDDASFYLNNVLESPHGDNLERYANLFMAFVLFQKNSFDSAKKYANLVLQTTEDNCPIYALAFMLDYIVDERIGRESTVEHYEETLSLLEKYNLLNNRVNTSLLMPWPYLESAKSCKKFFDFVSGAMEASKKIGNDFSLSSATQWMGIVHAKNGDKEKALEYYFESDRLRTEIGELKSIIMIRNGISYEYLIHSEYQKAYDLINGFLNRINEIKDYSEVIITFWNLSNTLFYSRNYKETSHLYQTILNLMHLFKMEYFVYFGSADVILLKTIIDFNNGDYMQAKMSFHSISRNMKRLSSILLPYVDLLQAFIDLHDNNLEKSLTNFEKAVGVFNNVCSGNHHQLAYMYFEYAVVLNSFSYQKEADDFFEKGRQFSKEKELSYYRDIVSRLSVQEYAQARMPFSKINTNLEYIEDFAVKEQLVNRLHKKVQDAQFLNTLMNFSSQATTRPEYAQNVSQALLDYTLSEAVYIAEKTNDKWDVIAVATHAKENEECQLFDWEDIAKKGVATHDLVVHQDGKKIIYADISKFGFTGGLILIPTENTPFSLEDRNIISIALSSIQAQLTMLKQNEHLMEISSTDQLSQLKNRRALQDRLSIDAEMIRRYEKKNDAHLLISIVFIDLDNFKYYNDTFGHEVGDLLISCFSNLLKHIFRRVDFVSRFGGDEFVVLLPNTTTQESSFVLSRVKNGLIDAKHFIPDIENLLKQKLDIPKEQYLGFSAGICSNYDLPNRANLEEAMNNADKALYYSKQHGKNTWNLWSEITDTLPSTTEE